MLSLSQESERRTKILSITKVNGLISYLYFNRNVKEILSETESQFSKRVNQIIQDQKAREQREKRALESRNQLSSYFHSVSPTMGFVFDATH